VLDGLRGYGPSSPGIDRREAIVLEAKDVAPPAVGQDQGADRASDDADVSLIPRIIPYGGFSPVRLEGWPIRWGLPETGRLKPAPGMRRFPLSLRPSFVHRLASPSAVAGYAAGVEPSSANDRDSPVAFRAAALHCLRLRALG